jgi:uncharacterized membrane protein
MLHVHAKTPSTLCMAIINLANNITVQLSYNVTEGTNRLCRYKRVRGVVKVKKNNFKIKHGLQAYYVYCCLLFLLFSYLYYVYYFYCLYFLIYLLFLLLFIFCYIIIFIMFMYSYFYVCNILCIVFRCVVLCTVCV